MFRLSAVPATAALVGAALVATASAQQPARTIAFQEVDKGSTFHVIDNPPLSKHRHGFPTRVSPGDAYVFTTPLRQGGKAFGRLRATCTITQAGNPGRANADCTGVFDLPGGQLWANASTTGNSRVTRGAIVGGTGSFAGARGTFVSRSRKNASDDVITLLG